MTWRSNVWEDDELEGGVTISLNLALGVGVRLGLGVRREGLRVGADFEDV